jgi:hypothetical protein
MNYWLHRISHHAHIAHPLLFKHNKLTIGFSEFSNQKFIDDVLKPNNHIERLHVVDDYIRSIWGGKETEHRTRYNIWRFIEGFRENDYVIIPTQGKFSVFKLKGNPQPIGNLNIEELKDWSNTTVKTDDLLSIENKTLDIGFYWNVEPVQLWIERYEYADAKLTSRMKIRTTNTLITELKKSVEKAILGKQKNKPINLYTSIIESAVPTVLKNILTDLDDSKLEKLVKWYFDRIGATSTFIPSKNESGKEGDADIVAVFEPLKTIYYVQAKFHKGTTGNWATHQIIDYRNKKIEQSAHDTMDDGYNKVSWVVSTGDNFDEESLRLAQEYRVQLINGEELSRLILEAGISDLNGLI